jgi:hypothetical protein
MFFNEMNTYASGYVQQRLRVLDETGDDDVREPWVARGHGLANAAAFQSAFAFEGPRGHDPAYEGERDSVCFGCRRRDPDSEGPRQ